MTPEFKRALARTVKIEGGFTDNSADRGGPTNHGITLRQFQHWRPGATLDDLKAITQEDAAQFYFDGYWATRWLPCQALADLWEPLAQECFDSAVLHGPDVSARFLQQALNLLNLHAKAWADRPVDGKVGDNTLADVRAALAMPRGRERLLLAVNIEQAVYLREIALTDPTQEAFYGGWIMNRVQLTGDRP